VPPGWSGGSNRAESFCLSSGVNPRYGEAILIRYIANMETTMKFIEDIPEG